MSEGQEYDFSDAVNPFESGGSSYDFSDAVNPFESEPNSPSSEKAETDPGVISNIPNTMRRVGERSVELGGNLIEFIGSVAEKGGTALTEFTGVNPGIQWGDDGISFTMNVDPQNDIGGAVQDFGAKGADVDFGYQPTFTWEGLKEDITPSNLAGYIIEQGVGSVPDMAAAMATLPAYIMSRTQEIAETRSLNKDQAEVTARDLAESVIPAVSVSLLERFGAKGVFKPKGATGFKQIGREAGKAAAKEGLTEFAQEQVEYAGETVGTENPFDWGTSLDRGAAGAVAGSGFGGGARAVSATIQRGEESIDRTIDRIADTETVDQAIEVAMDEIDLNELEDINFMQDDAIKETVENPLYAKNIVDFESGTAPEALSVDNFSTEPVSRLGEFNENGIDFAPDMRLVDRLAAGVESEIDQFENGVSESESLPSFKEEEEAIKARGEWRELKTALASIGGLDRESSAAEGIFDGKNVRAGKGWLFRKKDALTVDGALERLNELGFQFADKNELIDAITDSVQGRGERYSTTGQEPQSLYEAKRQEEDQKQLFDAGEWTLEATEPVYNPESTLQEKALADEAIKAIDGGKSSVDIGDILSQYEQQQSDWGAIVALQGTDNDSETTKNSDPQGQTISSRDGERQYQKNSERERTSFDPEELGSVSVQSSEIDSAANKSATSPLNTLPDPTPSQIEAGNYKKGHVSIQGLDLSIENPKGAKRSGTDQNGNSWEVEMQQHYGYIKRTTGADNEQVDVFVGDNVSSPKAFVVDQINEDGSFDEHKVMLGFNDQQSASEAYKSNYSEGWKVGPVTEMSMDEFKSWLKEGDNRLPVSDSLIAPSDATATLAGNELGSWDNVKDLRRKAVEFAKGNLYGKTIINSSTGDEILINRTGIAKTLGHAAKAGKVGDHIVSTVALPKMLESATLIETTPDRKGRSEIKAVKRFASEVDIGGRDYDVELIVRETNDGNKFYDHMLIKRKADGSAGDSFESLQPSSTSQPEGLDQSIGSEAEIVNKNELNQPIPLSDIDLEIIYDVNETGESFKSTQKADAVLSDIDNRIDGLKSLIGCLRKS